MGFKNIYTMNFRTRKLIKPEDLNARGTLFGGRVLAWIDEELLSLRYVNWAKRILLPKQ